jgi:hypothetical protein
MLKAIKITQTIYIFKWMAEEYHGNEVRQKAIYAHLNLPHSPVLPPREFPAPTPIENPLEDLSSYVPVDEIEEELDHGSREKRSKRRQDDIDDETEEEGSFHEDDGDDEDGEDNKDDNDD